MPQTYSRSITPAFSALCAIPRGTVTALPVLAALLFMAAAASLAQSGAAGSQAQEQLLATLTSNAPLAEKWVAAHQLARIGTR